LFTCPFLFFPGCPRKQFNDSRYKYSFCPFHNITQVGWQRDE